MTFLHLNFVNFEFRDLGHSDFLSFKVLAPTRWSWSLLESESQYNSLGKSFPVFV